MKQLDPNIVLKIKLEPIGLYSVSDGQKTRCGTLVLNCSQIIRESITAEQVCAWPWPLSRVDGFGVEFQRDQIPHVLVALERMLRGQFASKSTIAAYNRKVLGLGRLNHLKTSPLPAPKV